MLPLQPPASLEWEEDRAEFIDANNLPDDWMPDPEDLIPFWFLFD